MPIYSRHWVQSPEGTTQALLLKRGPALELEISVTGGHAKALIATGVAVPQPIVGTGLIDTGAGITAVDVQILDALGLNPISTTPISGPTGQEEQGVYMCQIKFLGTDIPPIDQAVVGSQLANFGHVALLGRNLLQNCLLIYDGQSAMWTLAV